jgi:beta-lactamase class A
LSKVSGVFLAALILLAAALLSYGCSDDTASESPTGTVEGATTSSEPEQRAREHERTSGPGDTSAERAQETPRSTDEEASQSKGSRSEEADIGALAAEIESIARSHPGDYGVVVYQPSSGKRVSFNNERSFPSASLAKLPVLLALYREAAAGRVDLEEKVQMRLSDIAPGTGVLQGYPPGTTFTLREYAHFLVSESDNTAWAVIQRRLTEKRVEAELDNIGARSTHYEYGHHTTTPEDVLRMLERISDPAYTSPMLCEEMLSAMTGTAFEDRLPQGTPPDTRVAHKIGILGDVFSDAGVVYPAGHKEEHYYIVVFSDGAPETASRTAMQKMSSAAYRSLVDPEAMPRFEQPESSG